MTDKTLSDLEKEFDANPSLNTGKTWLNKAIKEWEKHNIQIVELVRINKAFATWCKVNDQHQDPIRRPPVALFH